MSTESEIGKEVVARPSNALVPTTREQTKALVLSGIKSAFAGTGQSIGVSRNWLIKHVEELGLNEDEVTTLVMIRTEFRGLLPHVVKLLYKGLTVEDVYGCYRTQRSLRELMSSREYNASLKKVAMLIRTFAEADPANEELHEMILEAHKVISEQYFWVHYVDQSISILCAIAKEHGCCTIDAALAMVNSSRAKAAGMMPGDEDD